MRTNLPSGTVTFLFTDVEGSTKLLHELGAEGYAAALAEHRRAIREACARHDGVEVDTQGDAFFFAFPSAPGALAAADEMTQALASGQIQVRIGLHTGAPLLTEEGYIGNDVHFGARVAASSHGGQVVLSSATAKLVELPLADLGEHRLKDIEEPVSIFQLGDGQFPPLKTISNTNLPRPASSFVGRDDELQEVLSRIGAGARLVTLTGPGGTGKTRLALEAAATLVPEYKAGVFWVGLAGLRDPALVTETLAQTLGAKDRLAEHLGEREMLLLLDNLEQVIEAAPELSSLLNSCPNLTLIVTSRELLRVQGEVEYLVPPLTEPDAVSLFCERAQLEPTDDIRELCTRLDNLPLAVELAAARTKALAPTQILERLSQRLDLLKGGRDADPRQQTLRATIEWSYDLLVPEEQRLFARLSVFAGGCTLEAAEEVAEADLDTLQSLVEQSLLRFSNERYWMLETIREFAGERLAATGGADSIRRRLRRHAVALAEASGEALLKDARATSARLGPEYPNIREAVSHALASREPDDVGRLLGALFPFLITRGHVTEARIWLDAVLDDRARLSDQGLVATLLGGGEIARFAGDLDLAIALKEDLLVADGDGEAALWTAGTLADLCDIAMDQGDFDGARRYGERSMAAGGAQRASLSLADLALRVGELDSAERHCLEALAAWQEEDVNYPYALEIFGETARRSGDVRGAREHFSRALVLFMEMGDEGGIADCLDGFARLAFEVGDVVHAGQLCGAAQRSREVSGRRPIRTDLPLPVVPDTARAEGAALTLEQALAYALGSLD